MGEPRNTALRRTLPGVAIAAVAAIAWAGCFIATIHAFDGMDVGAPVSPLVLGIPVPTVGLMLFALLLGMGVVIASGSADAASGRRPVAGVFLVLAGLGGLLAAWSLTADKAVTLTDPETQLECNFSLLVQCGANLASWQGAVFGFPNPLLGLGGWAAVIVVGVALAAGIRLPNPLWGAFTVGVVGAMGFVTWLIAQSIFELGTLCPWCMVTWAVTIPVFWFTIAELLRRVGGPRAAAAAAGAITWLPLLTLLSYLVVALVAQLGLDVIAYL